MKGSRNSIVVALFNKHRCGWIKRIYIAFKNVILLKVMKMVIFMRNDGPTLFEPIHHGNTRHS
jgi:hypothetical protein